VLASICSQELEYLVTATFYIAHAIAADNQSIQILEKMQEFASTVLATLTPYRNQTTERTNK